MINFLVLLLRTLMQLQLKVTSLLLYFWAIKYLHKKWVPRKFSYKEVIQLQMKLSYKFFLLTQTITFLIFFSNNKANITQWYHLQDKIITTRVLILMKDFLSERRLSQHNNNNSPLLNNLLNYQPKKYLEIQPKMKNL